MSDPKIVTCVNDHFDEIIREKLSNELNVEFVQLTAFEKLIRLLSSKSYHTDTVLIDLEKLSNYDNVGLFDMVMTLNTLTNCYCSLRSKVNSIPIGIIATLDSNLTLIQEVMNNGLISGIYPSGSDFSFEEKSIALEGIINRQNHIPEKIKKRIHQRKRTQKPKTKSSEITLTTRQKQILDLIITKGASNKLIARILNISESTVKLHMTQILKKHNLTNRTQLALFVKTKTDV